MNEIYQVNIFQIFGGFNFFFLNEIMYEIKHTYKTSNIKQAKSEILWLYQYWGNLKTFLFGLSCFTFGYNFSSYKRKC